MALFLAWAIRFRVHWRQVRAAAENSDNIESVSVEVAIVPTTRVNFGNSEAQTQESRSRCLKT